MAKREFIQFADWIARMYPEYQETYIENDCLTQSMPAKTFTFQVTDACNLACTYCYQINKGVRKMPLEIAKLAVDKLLSGADGFEDYIGLKNTPAIILEFIGGEPFLEIDLIDKIVDYFRLRTIELEHPWAEKFMISICSNGVLYKDTRVQKFLQKNAGIISFSVTVDGTKKLHDSCRIFPDGRPSYDLAHFAAKDWMDRGYYMGSKITIAPENVKYLSESLKQMITDEYLDINANCVYEKGWKPKHATILYEQCKDFANWFSKNHDNNEISLSLLDERFGHPQSIDYLDNWCGGTGKMLAMDPDGKLYPCIRYMESSLGEEIEPIIIGDVHTGLAKKQCEMDCIDCLNKITRRTQSTDECFYCPIGQGCSWCSALNFQETGSVDKRVTYICEMHKARSLACVYYWNTYHKKVKDGLVMDLWVPKQWAIPIIGEEEYNYLVSLTKELGGYVNENASMVKMKETYETLNREFNKIEILSVK